MRKTNRNVRSRRILMAAAAGATLACLAHSSIVTAATLTWSGASSTNWSDGGNWDGTPLGAFEVGTGEAGAFPNASIAVARWFPVHERGRAFGFALMASQLGGAIAPLLVVPIQVHRRE